MPAIDDATLLKDYAQTGSETAFAELVQRHVGLVYAAAVRHVGVAAQAEEITQAVFIILARKAAGLRAGIILESWLYTTTRLTALSFLRGERRRQHREHEAYMQSDLHSSNNDDDVWRQFAPLLDEAMMRLGQKDRDALMLRYFKNQSVRDVAAALQIKESAAQLRILRAVERLRALFAKQGMAFPAASLTAAISTHSAQGASVALAKSVATVAATQGATASISTLTLTQGALKIMAWTKTKTTLMGVMVIACVLTATSLIIHRAQASRSQNWTPGQLTAAGYSTPEAALKTMMWAIKNGDAEVLLASFTPVERANAENALHGHFDKMVEALSGRMSTVAGFQITVEPGAPDNVTVDVVSVSRRADGHTHERKYWFKKIGQEWKCDQIHPSFDLTN